MGGSSSKSEDTKKQRWGIKQKHIGQLQKMCLHTKMKVVLHGVAWCCRNNGDRGDWWGHGVEGSATARRSPEIHAVSSRHADRNL